MESRALFEEAVACFKKNKPAALATVTGVTGSTPARVGAKMLVYADGTTLGTVGGGKLEAEVIKAARQAINNMEPLFSDYSLNADDVDGPCMICGGRVSVFIEPLLPASQLLIAGAGHVSRYVARLGKMLGFEVVVVDDRPEFANQELFPEADRLIVNDIGQALAEYKITGNTCIVIVTRGHQYDEAALESVVNSNAAYIGMIGSEKKVKTIFDNLRRKGIKDAALDKVYAPIGLKIGGKTPPEIAVSILAEILQVRYTKKNKEA